MNEYRVNHLVEDSMEPDQSSNAVGWPTITVIIPVYNDVDRLRSCLKSLQHQDYPADRYDVVIVDNASTQDLRPALPAGDRRFLLTHEQQRGSYAARNTGVRLASGTVLAFTDADCLPRPNWLTAGVSALQQNPQPDAVGGNIVLTFRDGEGPRTAPEYYDAREGLPQEHFVLYASFAATANLFVGAETFQAVGQFDSSLKSGGDRQWGERLVASGRHLAFARDAVVEHPARPTWRELTRKSRRIAHGVADLQAADPPRAVLADIACEARAVASFCKEVWTLETPSRTAERLAFAAAFGYARLLRSGIRLQRLALRPVNRIKRAPAR